MHPDTYKILSSAISDTGIWAWWTANLPKVIQLEFVGAQIYNAPASSTEVPSSTIALNFKQLRYCAFMERNPDVIENWQDLLQEDKLKLPAVDHDNFAINDIKEFNRIIQQRTKEHSIVGTHTDLNTAENAAFTLAFWAEHYGMIIVAEHFKIMTHTGEILPENVITRNAEWWTYWKEYHTRRTTENPMPFDHFCEILIPLTQ